VVTYILDFSTLKTDYSSPKRYIHPSPEPDFQDANMIYAQKKPLTSFHTDQAALCTCILTFHYPSGHSVKKSSHTYIPGGRSVKEFDNNLPPDTIFTD